MICYICKSETAGWSLKYEKDLCQHCWDTLETLEIFQDRVLELSKTVEKIKE